MREYTTPLLKQFSLRDDEYRPSKGGLVECLNARAGDGYIEGYAPNIRPFTTIYSGASPVSISVDWPFPQIFLTDRGIVLGKRDGLYVLSYAASKWSIATLVQRVAAAAVNWPYTLANVPMFPVIASGDLLFYYDYNDGSPRDIGWNISDSGGESGDKWNSGWRQPIAACFNHGQVFLGGASTYEGTPSHSRLIRWSQIGTFDFLGHTANENLNTAGEWYQQTSDKDMVMAIKSLDKATLVYSQFGVFALVPVATPVPTFAFKRIYEGGINNPLAVGGGDKEHVFVDRLGTLCSVNAKLEVTQLGFSEFLAPLNRDTVIATGTNLLSVQYNPLEEEYYIGNGDEGFILNEDGFVGCSKTVSGLVSFEDSNSLVAAQFGMSPGGSLGFTLDGGNKHLQLVTEPTDLGIPAIKTVQMVTVLSSLPEGAQMEVAVDWRMDRSTPFRRSKWVRANPEGAAYPLISAVEFRICVRIIPFDGARVYAINVGWKSSDRRNIRGTYDASKAGDGSGT